MNGASLIQHHCRICTRPTTQWCSRCQNVWYCSAEHSEADWSRHRNECTPAVPQTSHHVVIQTPPLAVPEIVRVSALFFHPNQERPQVIVVNCQPSRAHGGSCPMPAIQDYFIESRPLSIVLTQGLNGEPLRFPLHVFYCPVALQRGSPLNRGVQRIANAAARPWAGPVVVLKFNGSRRQNYTDATTNDLPALSAYFLAYK